MFEDTTRVNGELFEVKKSFNAWSSGIWICSATGASAAMAAAGGSKVRRSSRNRSPR